MLRLHASIDFEGQESRSLSDPFLLPVAISESVNDVRASLAAALSAGQLDTAYSRLGRQFNDERILDGLSPDVLQAVVTALQGCTPGDTSDFHAICAGPVTLPDRSRQLHFLFVVDMVGHWRLISW